MNVAYPAESFLSPAATVAGFFDLLKGGFENPEARSGTVEITVPEHPEVSFRARFADTLLVDRPGVAFETDTKMVFPICTLEKMFREFEFLDWRSPEMWEDFGPVFFDREDFIPPHLWFGSVATDIPATHLHRDPLHVKWAMWPVQSDWLFRGLARWGPPPVWLV